MEALLIHMEEALIRSELCLVFLALFSMCSERIYRTRLIRSDAFLIRSEALLIRSEEPLIRSEICLVFFSLFPMYSERINQTRLIRSEEALIRSELSAHFRMLDRST